MALPFTPGHSIRRSVYLEAAGYILSWNYLKHKDGNMQLFCFLSNVYRRRLYTDYISEDCNLCKQLDGLKSDINLFTVLSGCFLGLFSSVPKMEVLRSSVTLVKAPNYKTLFVT
jgi:hypothetical protein